MGKTKGSSFSTVLEGMSHTKSSGEGRTQPSSSQGLHSHLSKPTKHEMKALASADVTETSQPVDQAGKSIKDTSILNLLTTPGAAPIEPANPKLSNPRDSDSEEPATTPVSATAIEDKGTAAGNEAAASSNATSADGIFVAPVAVTSAGSKDHQDTSPHGSNLSKDDLESMKQAPRAASGTLSSDRTPTTTQKSAPNDEGRLLNAVDPTRDAHNLISKPAVPDAGLSVQSRRPNENPLNVSKARAAAKAEIESAVSNAKSPALNSHVSPHASPSAAASVADSLSTSNVRGGNVQAPEGVQKSAVSQHKNGDGAGSKPQSGEEGSQRSANTLGRDTTVTDGSHAQPSQAANSPAPTQISPLVSEGRNRGPMSGEFAKNTAHPADAGQSKAEIAETHVPSRAEAYPASMISSAKLVERLGASELKLGIRSGEFGSIDIRTSMMRNQFTAEISVERGELGRVLAAELPSLQNRLTEQRIPVTHIVLQNQAGGDSGTSEQQKPRHEQATPSQSSGSMYEEASGTRVLAAAAVSAAAYAEARLDIHM